MRDHSIFDEEVRFRRRDGVVRWARIVSMPREQADGSWVWDGIQLDITAQKEAERELRELNATLEERVAARAAELAQAQEALRQSQKLESMGQLTGGVAHDFNNLLSPIIGGLDMLQRRRVGDERAQRTIGAALESAERAKMLVQRLLAFARRQPLQPRAVDVVELVRGMASLLESTLGPRVHVELRLPNELAAAQADANQLEMALLNLALNARDAMPEGGTLTIAADEVDTMLTLSVIDTGVGMDEQTRAQSIEPFFSTKGVGHGTGLGLSMVHGLASQLGGELRLDSAPGVGTRIELRLPIADADAATPVAPSFFEPARAKGVALLVDDETLVRSSTADMLADMGFQVIEAGSADAALDVLNTGAAPDVLVTDHLMPGMSGAELVVAARAVRPGIPVLLVTGYAGVESLAPDLPRLTKPFRRDELYVAIEGALATAAIA
jgi:signal transduction histidine kinase/CheY-like chemotaxis protein